MKGRKRTFRSERQILGLRLKLARIKSGLTQQELGRRVDRRHSYVSRIELAEQPIDIVELLDLLSIMNVDPKEFLSEFLDECRHG